MKRVSILIVAILIGAAAPARAWCEASCLLPRSESGTPHCPAHEPASDGPTLSAGSLDDCPVVDAARPVFGKMQFFRAASSETWRLAPTLIRTQAARHPGTQAPRHPITIPLRI